MPTNRRIVLASRPQGAATTSNFRLEEVPVPALLPGQILVRNHWLSLDPYMRGRMNEGRSYAAAQALNEVMVGGTAGEVVESRHAGFTAGDKVVAYLGVTTHLEDLVKGVVDLKDLVFYLSVVTFGLFLAQQSVESQRWRA